MSWGEKDYRGKVEVNLKIDQVLNSFFFKRPHTDGLVQQII
jgi:hypothetical protein